MRRAITLIAVLFSVLAFAACEKNESVGGDVGGNTCSVRILATSDLHGKFVPWDYTTNSENKSGSAAQLKTAIDAYRTDQTLLVDAGDLIQGNFADFFVQRDGVHPMVQAMNQMNYDVWITGNHEYNFGMDALRKTIADLDVNVLTGNVYDESGKPIAAGYKIFEVDGVNVAVIGMVTPNISHWDENNLKNCKVTDPLTETRKILDKINGKYDVLIGVFHMGIENEYGVPNSGVTDICNACPEFDVMVSSHEHKQIESMNINGVLVVQNKNMAQTMSVIDLSLTADGSSWKLTKKKAQSICIDKYEPDPAMEKMLEEDHQVALKESEKVIGVLKGGPLIANDASSEEMLSQTELPLAQVQDTALVDLINQVQLHYSGAKVSTAPLCDPKSNLEEGEIHLYDTARIFSFDNTLYTVRMNGAQLKKFMEWTAGYYNTTNLKMSGISANPDFPSYNYLMFQGVAYEIDLSQPVGERIKNLTWPDGTPVDEKERFVLALNNYNANSYVLIPGEIYSKDDLPELVEMDVRGDIGGIRELIGDYIIHVKNGVLTPECDHNWRIR